MIEKARENLRAAGCLIDEGCPNAAASRAYYAAYQACWWALEKTGEEPPEPRPGERWWPHKEISGISRRFLIGFETDDEDDFDNILLFRRIKADYDPDPVLEYEVRECVHIAGDLLEKIAGGDLE